MLRERKILREGNINGRKTAREGRCGEKEDAEGRKIFREGKY